MLKYHTPVLVQEVIRYLCTVQDGLYVDCTLGGGGHAAEILQHTSPRGTLIGFDRDPDALNAAQERLSEYGNRIQLVHDNFASIRKRLSELNIPRVHGVLADLGLSSYQIDNVERGFSFQSESRLDMRMNKQQALDAWTVINMYSETQISDILWKFGEERFSRRIAKRIAIARLEHPLDTTSQLSDVVRSAVGGQMLTKSLARVFQALRIEVNNELESLKQALEDFQEILVPSGRMVVISYHSLEDRIVKQFIRNASTVPYSPIPIPLAADRSKMTLRNLTKKPVVPAEEEIITNSRSRSAKLRAAERI